MGFLNLFVKRDVSRETIYKLHCELHPMRLVAHKNEFAELDVVLENASDQEMLTSLVAVCPRTIGFDRTGLQQEREIRLGMLRPGEQKSQRIQLWSTQRTEPGEYKLKVFAISHYRDYGHVLNEVRKDLSLRVSR